MQNQNQSATDQQVKSQVQSNLQNDANGNIKPQEEKAADKEGIEQDGSIKNTK